MKYPLMYLKTKFDVVKCQLLKLEAAFLNEVEKEILDRIEWLECGVEDLTLALKRDIETNKNIEHHLSEIKKRHAHSKAEDPS